MDYFHFTIGVSGELEPEDSNNVVNYGVNRPTDRKESNVKERDFGKTKQVEKTLEKVGPQLNGPMQA